MVHDEAGYRSFAFQSNGTLIGKPPRVFSYWWSGRSCSECEWYSKQFEPIAQCECCRRFRREGPTGVDTRYDCRKVSKDWQPSPKLCVGCWNRLRAVRRRLRELDGIRLEIDRIVRTRRESARATTG
jgi:hypothetical protein